MLLGIVKHLLYQYHLIAYLVLVLFYIEKRNGKGASVC